MSRVYLDFAAAAPVSPRAMRAFLRASRCFGNPSSVHEEGRRAKELLEEARTKIARELSVKSDAVIFTSGASEANALAIRGHVKALKARGRNDIHLLYNPGAHASVVAVMEGLAREGVAVEELSVAGGAVDLKELKKQLRKETALVSLEAVNGETGTRFDTRAVAALLIGRETLLHVDAAQLPMVESCERTRLGADLITLDASKIGGVRGIGVLVAERSIPLLPVLEGGGQERDVRSGTQTPALAAAFALALVEAGTRREQFAARAERQRRMLLTKIAAIEGAVFNEGEKQVPHLISISFPGRDTEYLAALLNDRGYAVAVRSACETDEAVSRAVLRETQDDARARSTLRVSWGPSTTDGDLRRFVRVLESAARFLDRSAV